MPRLMSVTLTEQAVRDRRKTVTRRLGWRMLKQGDRLTLCRKVMGRKKDEPLERLAEVVVVSVRRERLSQITQDEVEREGLRHTDGDFAEWDTETGYPTPAAWVEWFCEEMGVDPYDDITRIEWTYLDASCPGCATDGSNAMGLQGHLPTCIYNADYEDAARHGHAW